MKIMVVGGGGREHAMARALATDSDAELIIAPGNPGTAALGRNVAVSATDVDELVQLAQSEAVDLVIPGPEAPLVAGLADALFAVGVPCCGPGSQAARLEGSKTFTRELCTAAGVPSPSYEVVGDPEALKDALKTFQTPPVVKADGLAGGKGVFLPDTHEDCLSVGLALLQGKLGAAGRTLVLEERLVGTEASLFYACSGQAFVALPHARDHKRLLNGGRGPNTGGMGAVSPNSALDSEVETEVATRVVRPVLRQLEESGTPFRGFLFVGLMLTDAGPKVLEFNVRLGDPEAQAILPRLAPGLFAALCRAVAQGELQKFELEVDTRPTCAVVVTAAGYPEVVRKGDVVTLSPSLITTDRWLVHAGTTLRDGRLVTAGGRVAAVVTRGDTVEQATASAYEGVAEIIFDGMHYRTDIGREP